MSWVLIQGLSALLVTGTPLLVVVVVDTVAARELRGLAPSAALPRGSRWWLALATVLLWAAFALWFALDLTAFAARRRDLALASAELASFGILSALGMVWMGRTVRATHRIVREALPESDDVVRRASLRPRRLTVALSWPLLSVPYLVALLGGALLTLRLPDSWTSGPFPWRPVGFALVGLVFLFLYGAWLRQEAHLPRVLDPHAPAQDVEAQSAWERRTRLRRIYGAQLALVAVFAGLSVVLAPLDWSDPGGRTISMAAELVGAVVGVMGCALALSSELSRHHVAVSHRVQRS